ncbi:unnamed protein product [Sphenostylis stenocarpa]|uniref:Uncharacterized protein n=1 Tax=Sphenostylis stenocarpa TaxID=92480 RepID=A0AA86SLG0_9FABA|nr:unnamed protein product [Sphenostylis stenocarpa]
MTYYIKHPQLLQIAFHITWSIWSMRNSIRISNSTITLEQAIKRIITDVMLFGKIAKGTGTVSMDTFQILKNLFATITPSAPTRTASVIWLPPFTNWINETERVKVDSLVAF